jgi:hypothetical protein
VFKYPGSNPLISGKSDALFTPIHNLLEDGIKEITFQKIHSSSSPLLEAYQQSLATLKQFASSSTWAQTIDLAFGNNWNLDAAKAIIQSWKNDSFRSLPKIEISNEVDFLGANGVYSTERDTIYLSESFLRHNAQNISAIKNVILEEIGHAIDARINVVDAVGDEGDIFQRLVQGSLISTNDLANLKAESDFTSLVIDGKDLVVEQSSTLTGSPSVPDFDENKVLSIQDSSGRLRIFAIGEDSNVWQWRESDNNMTWWHKMELSAKELEVVQDKQGRVRVFGIGTDNNVWQWRESDNNMTWWHKMELSAKELEVVQDKQGRVRVFGIGTDNNVWQWRESDNNTTWWHKMELSAKELEITQDRNGFVRAFGIGTDGNVWQWRESDNNMTWWHKMGLSGQGEIEVAKDRTGNLRVFAVSTDNNIWQWRESDNNMTWWHKMGLSSRGSLEVTQDRNGFVRAFGIGTDGNVWQWRESDNNMTWWHKMGLSGQGEIEVAKDRTGNLRVFAVSTDNNIWQWRESDNNMTWWHKMGLSGTDITAIQGADGNIRVLGISTDRNAWQWRESDNNMTWWHKMGLLIQDAITPPTQQLPSSSSLPITVSEANRSFKLQFQHPTFNPDGPRASNNCGPSSLAMVISALGLEPPGLSVQASINRASALMQRRSTAWSNWDELRTGIRNAGGRPEDVNSWSVLDQKLAEGKPVIANGFYGESWRLQFPSYASTGNGSVSHINAILGRTKDGRYLVADPMYRGGTVEMTREQLAVFFGNKNPVGLAFAK